MAIAVEQQYLPVIRIAHDGATSDEDFERYLNTLRDSMYAPNAGHRLLVIDATYSAPTPATQRRMQADWMKEHADRIRKFTVGVAFVIPSGMIRGMLTAIFWIQPLPSPHEVCATLEQALDWGDTQLAAYGLEIPPHARVDWLSRKPLALHVHG